MYDILSIESFRLDPVSDNIIVRAILENISYIAGSQTYLDPPEYAPSLCETTISTDGLPMTTELRNNEEYLEEIVNRHNLLANQDWRPVYEDYSYVDED